MCYPMANFNFSGYACPFRSGYSPNDPRATEPTAQNAFIGMTTAATVANNAAIPLSTVFNVSGNHIIGSNPITLRAGHKYLVEYNVIGKPALSTDTFGVKLQLNGTDVAGSAAAAAAVATVQSIGGGAIVTVTAGTGSSLTLVGVSTTSATYNYASVRIVEVE